MASLVKHTVKEKLDFSNKIRENLTVLELEISSDEDEEAAVVLSSRERRNN